MHLAKAFYIPTLSRNMVARRTEQLDLSLSVLLRLGPHLSYCRSTQVINIEPEYMLEGRVQAWNPTTGPRQWLTRIEYLGRSPYEVIRLQCIPTTLFLEQITLSIGFGCCLPYVLLVACSGQG